MPDKQNIFKVIKIMKNSIITAILAFCCMPIMAQTGSGDTAYEVKGTCPTDIAKVYVIDLMKGVKTVHLSLIHI